MPAAASRSRYRLLALALAASAVLHAAVFVGMPRRLAAIGDTAGAVYLATLVTAAPRAVQALPDQAPPPRPAAKRAAPRPQPALLAAAVLDSLDAAGGDGDAMGAGDGAEAAASRATTPTDKELLAAPEIAPVPEEPVAIAAAEAEKFPVGALPAKVSIAYQITSAVADGRAVYRWAREGDSYRITGEAEAQGFFTLFLEGQIQQESSGTVTDAGLRPDRFVETRPDNVREGLEFDWPGRKVTFSRSGNSNTSALADNTVDWLSMIFQLAHVPPQGESVPMQVFTQRRMYQFRLQVIGVEEIDIPIGRVRALHLRHFDPAEKREAVDVWLGLDQHNLPVKLRFPVARNRLMVEQVATRVSVR